MTSRKVDRVVFIKAGRPVTDRGVAVAQAARDLAVAKSVLWRWMQEWSAALVAAFLGTGRRRITLPGNILHARSRFIAEFALPV